MVPSGRSHAPSPTLRTASRQLAFRVAIPAVALVAVGLFVGFVVVTPLAAWTGEDRLAVWLQARRTPSLDWLAIVASQIGGVRGNAVICVLAVAVLWLATRQWWIAAMPALALTLHIWIHITTSTLVGRPRPDVEQLDIGQPTASFPSGHMGATTAQLLVVTLIICHRVKNRAVRILVVGLTCGYLVVLAWSRIYLGMHHPSDVAWGAVNGIACGLMAWHYLRSNPLAPGTAPLRVP